MLPYGHELDFEILAVEPLPRVQAEHKGLCASMVTSVPSIYRTVVRYQRRFGPEEGAGALAIREGSWYSVRLGEWSNLDLSLRHE